MQRTSRKSAANSTLVGRDGRDGSLSTKLMTLATQLRRRESLFNARAARCDHLKAVASRLQSKYASLKTEDTALRDENERLKRQVAVQEEHLAAQKPHALVARLKSHLGRLAWNGDLELLRQALESPVGKRPNAVAPNMAHTTEGSLGTGRSFYLCELTPPAASTNDRPTVRQPSPAQVTNARPTQSSRKRRVKARPIPTNAFGRKLLTPRESLFSEDRSSTNKPKEGEDADSMVTEDTLLARMTAPERQRRRRNPRNAANCLGCKS
ncbi:hypothetical protein BBJ28_00019002 [Nothophytophthora sp. Chile5]|nr:hypothetical protein BBJ28_00019002 [Nothophytophthora sp. Chile5]